MSQIEVRVITAAETWPLRLQVLRPGYPPVAAQFPGDDLPDTRHFGAFLKNSNQLVGIASLFLAEMPQRSECRALQLRGMATTPEVRGRGFGHALVSACVAFARDSGMDLLWCNARTGAVGFYRKLNWEIVGEEFEIPDVGPHFLMWRRIA